MIDASIKIGFNFDEKGKDDLDITLLTLMAIREGFEKVGFYSETDIETLKAAEHIVNEIQRGETF